MWKEEFKCETFKLEHSNLEDFSICNWQKGGGVQKAWLGYRIGLFIYYFLALVVILVLWHTENVIYYSTRNCMLYFANWSHVVQVVVFLVQMIVTIVDYKNQEGESGGNINIELLKKVHWFLYTMSVTNAILVFMIFWSSYENIGGSIGATLLGLQVFNSVLHIIDFFLVAFPHRFYHFYMPEILFIVFMLVNILYALLAMNDWQAPVYSLFDWRNDFINSLVTFIVIIIVVFIAHILLFLFYMMKKILRSNSGG